MAEADGNELDDEEVLQQRSKLPNRVALTLMAFVRREIYAAAYEPSEADHQPG